MCLAKWIGPFVSSLWMRLYVFGQVDRAFVSNLWMRLYVFGQVDRAFKLKTTRSVIQCPLLVMCRNVRHAAYSMLRLFTQK